MENGIKTESEIFDKFKMYGYFSYNEVYFSLAVAKNIIKEFEKNGIAIIGIDFVNIMDKKIIPVFPINSFDGSELITSLKNWPEIVSKLAKICIEIIREENDRDSTQCCVFTTMTNEEWMKEFSDKC